MEKDIGLTKQPIYPVQYVQAVTGGTAHVILCSDGNQYVMKMNTVSKRPKEMVNEYVFGKLAKLLSLPVIPFELIQLNEEFIKSTPALYANKPNYDPRLRYGSLVIENSIVFADKLETPPSKQEIINRNMLAGMIIFDQWVYNSNRSINNLLLQHTDKGGYYVHMINHDRCFPGGYRWNAKTIGSQKPEYRMLNQVYRWCYSMLDDDKLLVKFAERIKALPNEWIYEVIVSIPDEWEVTSEERETLYQYLIKEKVRMPKVASLFRKVIPLASTLNI
ncbi:HipA family kinase [Bacillus sp. Marseille-P3661]|uniref:HipA family kinase n=1 Tax=Bacillus sp. Marseille-P3661 TaxID=1936234 RepID=UPI000C84DC90|nr:HipA family kinase [Bacillus sp. Marseille-P3661]